VVYARPADDLHACAMLLAGLRTGQLPVVDAQAGAVLGFVSLRDVAGAVYEASLGGKEACLRRVLPRRGLERNTGVAQSAAFVAQALARYNPGAASTSTSSAAATAPHAATAPGGSWLGMDTGSAAFARLGRGGMQAGTVLDSSTSPSSVVAPSPASLSAPAPSASFWSASSAAAASEDAFFVAQAEVPTFAPDPIRPFAAAPADPSTAPLRTHHVTYLGVSDGVGVWASQGVDAALYSASLMAEAADHVRRWAADTTARGPAEAEAAPAPPSAAAVLQAAWEATRRKGVMGSATACVLALDSETFQLTVTAVGDSGALVLRRHASDLPSAPSSSGGGGGGGRGGGWSVVARSSQQLRGFNHPCQLGFVPGPGNDDKFETPDDAETMVFPVRLGDIVVAASDGLFDNMDEADIIDAVEAWERDHRQAGAASVPALATRLAVAARDHSVDRMRDGPFARLAKENDVFWRYGGRPDDITVVCGRITVKSPSAQ
jgi:protein phosphatase PTC7